MNIPLKKTFIASTLIETNNTEDDNNFKETLDEVLSKRTQEEVEKYNQ